MVAFNYQAFLHLHFVVNTLLYVNFYWSLVNLLPVYPLDGGQISRAIFEQRDSFSGYVRSLQLSIAVAGVIDLLAMLSQQMYLMILFAFLAISSLQTLQAASRRTPWRRY